MALEDRLIFGREPDANQRNSLNHSTSVEVASFLFN